MAMLACSSPSTSMAGAALRGGDAARGKVAAEHFGCNACHAIGGLPDPTVAAAAPITDISRRVYIAGTLPNTPENLMKWIRFPHEVKPGTAMPDLAVSASDARDIATYLYSLQ
ncbi:MAG: c-type cytochrome [Gemmatimonadota bacterium]|nr:c-type cytochrome [Gemmatimonadota bacterium]